MFFSESWRTSPPGKHFSNHWTSCFTRIKVVESRNIPVGELVDSKSINQSVKEKLFDSQYLLDSGELVGLEEYRAALGRKEGPHLLPFKLFLDYIFVIATPLLMSPFLIFEGCLGGSNPECYRNKRARFPNSHPLHLATHPFSS
jgi:hypothetical protein